MSGRSFYASATVELRRALAAAVPAEVLRRLSRRRPARHFLVLARTVFLLAASSAGAALLEPWWAFLPCAVVSGFTIFGFTVLLHEVVHGSIFEKNPRLNRLAGFLYAFPSGISRTQFTRWHLDHHAQLGDPMADPKRRHLSPKKNVRWLKLLYPTPALFFLYFRAAARETATYPADVQRRIRLERTFTLMGHAAILGALLILAGATVASKVYLVPYLFVFPVAFVLNRLGQHYAIDPEDPARWGTLMAPSRLWDFVFLWSSYHLEHHYFPGVPFYNMPELHAELAPFFEERRMKPRTYGWLLRKWYVENRAPHSRWETDLEGTKKVGSDGSDSPDDPTGTA
jgi:beta-carotene hydroxylase